MIMMLLHTHTHTHTYTRTHTHIYIYIYIFIVRFPLFSPQFVPVLWNATSRNCSKEHVDILM